MCVSCGSRRASNDLRGGRGRKRAGGPRRGFGSGFAEDGGDGAAEFGGVAGVAHDLPCFGHGFGASAGGGDSGADFFHVGDGVEHFAGARGVEPRGELADGDVRHLRDIVDILIGVEEMLADVVVLVVGEGRRRWEGLGEVDGGVVVERVEEWVWGVRGWRIGWRGVWRGGREVGRRVVGRGGSSGE